MQIENIKNFFFNLSGKKKYLVKTHKNHCKLFFFKKNNIYRKISRQKKGIKKIISEYWGLKWYCSLLKKKESKIIKKFNSNKSETYIETFNIDGYKIKSWNSLSKNYSSIKKVFYHYIRYFPHCKKHSIHGDLTFDNIIFKNKNLFIIDWEFFKSKKNYRGYDLAYFILSCLCLPYISKKKFSIEDEKIFLKLWKKLKTININKKILYDPFNFYEKNIKNNKILKDSYKISKSKFFPFITNNLYKKRIIKLINEKI